ncbi:MAG: hypothetical protein Q9218_000208 [Villophora microphyllina]
MVELRKRREAPSTGPEPPLKKSIPATKAKDDIDATEAALPVTAGVEADRKLTVGATIDLDGFGGEVETQDGDKTNLKKLVNDSKNGVVLFTYPKASTPGCTTQACLFRDEYTPLTATGYSIFGLSTDLPKSNTTFKTKQNLPFTLLCDPNAILIDAIGMKKGPKGTTRGVFVVDRFGRIEAVEPGGPAATVEVVRKLVSDAGRTTSVNAGNSMEAQAVQKNPEDDDNNVQDATAASGADSSGNQADVAAEVADTAEKLDGGADS